jgi:hypothetical protein
MFPEKIRKILSEIGRAFPKIEHFAELRLLLNRIFSTKIANSAINNPGTRLVY